MGDLKLIGLPPDLVTNDPRCDSQNDRPKEDRDGTIARSIEFKTLAGVPKQMANAIAEMEHQRDGEAEQNDAPDPTIKKRLRVGEPIGSRGCGDQPIGHQKRPETQPHTGDPVEDR